MSSHNGNERPSVTTVRPKGKGKGTREMCLSWDDDEGLKHTHILSNVCCIPDSPFNLLSVTEFGKPSTCSN